MTYALESIRMLLRERGAKPEHERVLLRAWIRGLPLSSGRHQPEHYLPEGICQGLPEISGELERLGRLLSAHPGQDGSERLLIELRDGQTAESVLLPRGGLCVSTQVGCAVRCLFCMTGRSGLVRQLGSAEILAQVALARSRRAVRRVVFMGMGEPSHNFEQVMEAIELLGTEGGIGHKQLVFSTVGDRSAFERLQQGRVKPALAVSLHSTRAELRAKLVPGAQRISPDELTELAQNYSQATGYPIQYQWTLLKGINDTEEEIEGLVRLLAGKYAVLNLIPYNPITGLCFERPDWEHGVDMTRTLHRRGILTKLRRSAGQDIEGACGQLRASRGATSGPQP